KERLSPKPKLKPKPLSPNIRLGKRSAPPIFVEPSGKDTFKKYYKCDLASTIAIYIRTSNSRAECFRTPNALYNLCEFDPLTLVAVSYYYILGSYLDYSRRTYLAAIEFLSATTLASSFEELKRCLGDLIGLI
ncbi:uncharacterized protein N7498_006380, partial [Penicillium cinerascens]